MLSALLDRVVAFRAEGLPLSASIPHAPRYLLKQWIGRETGEPGVHAVLAAANPPAHAPAGATLRARIGLLGDLMWIRGRSLQLSPPLVRLIASLDGLIGNLETPIDPDRPVHRHRPDWPTYNSPPNLLAPFARAAPNPLTTSHFLALSVANNHALDQGPSGLAATVRHLHAAGIAPVGLRGESPTLLELPHRGIRLALAGFAWGLNRPDPEAPIAQLHGLAPAPPDVDGVDLEPAFRAISTMPPGCLKVLVLHWGHEFEAYPSAVQVAVAQRLVAAGAQLVVGAHPHRPQPAAIWPCAAGGQGLVLFSLGNALSVMPGQIARTAPLVEIGIYSLPHTGELHVHPIATHWLHNHPGPMHHLDWFATTPGAMNLPRA